MFKNISYLSIDMEREEEFFKVYASVPLDERKNVLVVIDENPISWNLAYACIKNKSPDAGKILKILKEIGII